MNISVLLMFFILNRIFTKNRMMRWGKSNQIGSETKKCKEWNRFFNSTWEKNGKQYGIYSLDRILLMSKLLLLFVLCVAWYALCSVFGMTMKINLICLSACVFDDIYFTHHVLFAENASDINASNFIPFHSSI